MECKGAEKLLISVLVPCQSPVSHLKYPLLVVAIPFLSNNCFIMILSDGTAVFFILGLFFQIMIP